MVVITIGWAEMSFTEMFQHFIPSNFQMRLESVETINGIVKIVKRHPLRKYPPSITPIVGNHGIASVSNGPRNNERIDRHKALTNEIAISRNAWKSFRNGIPSARIWKICSPKRTTFSGNKRDDGKMEPIIAMYFKDTVMAMDRNSIYH